MIRWTSSSTEQPQIKTTIGGGLYEVRPRNALSSADSKVIMKIVQAFVDRSRKDIDKWRQAVQLAENPQTPRRYALQFGYKDYVIDLHLHSQMMVRKLAVLSKKFMVVDENGEEDKEKTKLFEKPWFQKFLSQALDEIFYGTTLIELGNLINGELDDVAVVPRTNVVPEQSKILIQYSDQDGFPYNTPQYDPWLIEVGEKEDFGLLYKIAPQVIWKRNAQQAWAEFMDKFGMPFRFAKTNSRDQKDIDRIEYMLEQMGSAAYGVFPQGTEIDFKDGKGSTGDGTQVFDKMIERCNSEMSKAINGTSTISDQKASGYKPELQADVKEEITESDMQFNEFLVNYKLIPKLIALGYPLNGNTWKYDMTESLGRMDQWTIVKDALLYFNIDPDWITQTFGFPIDSVKEATAGPTGQGGTPANFLKALPKNATRKVGPVVSGHVHDGSCCDIQVLNASAQSNLDAWLKEVQALYPSIFDKSLEADIPFPVYYQASKLLMQGFNEGFKDRTVDIAYNSPDHLKIAMYEANIHRFSAAGTWKDVVELNKLAGQSKNFNEFRDQAESYTGTRMPYLQTEYNTAEATAQNAANWLRQWDQRDEYDLQYQTAGDNRVRPAHRAFDGFKASATDPVWNWLYPPNDWNCRCEVIQIPKVTGRKADTSALDKSIVPAAFQYNKGKTDFIFEAGHQYFQDFPDEKNLGIKKWGMPSYDGFDFSKYPPLHSTIGTLEEFKLWYESELKRLGKDEKNIYYANYLGVNFRMQQGPVMNKFQKQKYQGQNRFGIAQFVEEMLQSPDEVWINTNASGRARYRGVYLKKYQDGLYAVITGTKDEQTPEIITWYKVDDLTNSGLGKLRHGILIKKAG